MKVSAYNPQNGTLIADAISGISFGNVRQGQHSTPVLIRPGRTVETNFTEMKLFLQNDGGLSASQFGYYVSDEFLTGIDYTNHLTGALTLATGVTGTGYTGVTGVSIGIVGGNPVDYVWLDAEVGVSETGATSTINYRFVFEFN